MQRVEVPGGNWRAGDCLMVYTSRGVLALEPPGPAAFSLWALGLNAALVAAQVPPSHHGVPLRRFPDLFTQAAGQHASPTALATSHVHGSLLKSVHGA